MAKPLVYNATLTERVNLTDSLAIFRVTPDESTRIQRPWFTAGQYCVLGMNNEAEPERGPVRRPMSMVSAAQHGGPVEFYIRYISAPASDNPLTHLLWGLGAGARMYMRAHAAGHFTIGHTIGEDDPRLRVMVAADTGVAPFISMLRSAALRAPGADLRQYALFYGASSPSELGYGDEMCELAEHCGLHYRATVDNAPSIWTGDTGPVEDYFVPARLDAVEEQLGLGRGGLNPDNAVVYVCGLHGTIGACIRHLAGRGFVPDHRRIRRAVEVPAEVPPSVFFEQYDTASVINTKDPAAVAALRKALAAFL